MLAAALIVLAPPVFSGDPEAAPRLEAPLRAALAATEGYGTWPAGPWKVRLHPDAASFERATAAPPGRAALWLGGVLHLRPWEQLRRRDLGAVLRHEAVHRRLAAAGLPRWEEEARCLHAETHAGPPAAWPPPPLPDVRARLDRALASGTNASQGWAYKSLRAWLAGAALPATPEAPPDRAGPWQDEARVPPQVLVRWQPERLPAELAVNGRSLRRGVAYTFRNGARFGPGGPVSSLPGQVEVRPLRRGWALVWTTDPLTWAAAATAGELGEDSPEEARRALAAVLLAWLGAHPAGNHPDGSLCPSTHCAVVRAGPAAATLAAAASAPRADPGWVWFCASNGGAPLSPRQVWGGGPAEAPPGQAVPGDPWAGWTRTLSAAQVQFLKRTVPPGLKPGQSGISFGASGPYAVERLRLAAGQAFGWTLWPGNACSCEVGADGSARLTGHGWGHNVGLCLATARAQALQGMAAEEILRAAFVVSAAPPPGPSSRNN